MKIELILLTFILSLGSSNVVFTQDTWGFGFQIGNTHRNTAVESLKFFQGQSEENEATNASISSFKMGVTVSKNIHPHIQLQSGFFINKFNERYILTSGDNVQPFSRNSRFQLTEEIAYRGYQIPLALKFIHSFDDMFNLKLLVGYHLGISAREKSLFRTILDGTYDRIDVNGNIISEEFNLFTQTNLSYPNRLYHLAEYGIEGEWMISSIVSFYTGISVNRGLNIASDVSIEVDTNLALPELVEASYSHSYHEVFIGMKYHIKN